MASNFELNIDVAVLEQANRKFETMVTNTAKVSANIKDINAALGGSSSAAAIVERISKAFDEISKKNVSPKFDDKNANTYVAALDKIVGFIDVISSKGALEIFNNKALYNSSNNILSLNDSLKEAKNNIDNIQKIWNNFNSKNRDKAEVEKFTGIKFPINQQTGKPFGDKTKAAKIWEEEIKKQLELQMRQAIEAKAIAENSLKWAKMTESEKTAYIEKELQKQLKAEERRISEAQRLYKSYLSQMNGLSRNINKNEARNDDGAMTATIEKQKASFQRLYDLKTKLEQDYGVHLVQIAEEYNAKALQITADRIRKETDAKKKAEAEALNKYLSTPEGALAYAGKASTRGEMKEAQKYLQSALDVVNKDDVDLIKKINDEYQRLRISIEQLSKASQNETTLLPTVRNEYSRLLRDLHKVTEAKERAAKTDAYKSGDSAAIQSYNDLLARERDLQNKIADIRRNAKGQLAEEDRKFNAEIAAQNVAETEKAERAKFEAERKRLLEIQELRRQTATRSTARANQIVDQSANVKNIAQEEQAVKKLEDARKRLNKNDADYEVTLKRINDAIAQHTHNIKMATDASYREAQAKKQAQQQNTTYQGAMDYSKNVKSINDQIKAIEYLKQARASLDRSSMSYNEYAIKVTQLTKEIERQQQEVDKLTGKKDGLKQAMGSLGNVVNQLKSQLTALFGVAAIKGYIQQLVNVRKEFERQQTALKGILQSKDEANKLWSQTTQLALKSPFSVKELITYTKQLSAYRIETEKLHDTTKRLADVSAGLGVDMSRLILAYGQVRAAEYLRGTELRQFTEAGIPMLEELAKYFTELEGRAVSTAQVFNMISKRMVEFEDVEAVIHRMTDEGGVFFEMQEQQSKTLHGELSNLRDAYELMLNSIGESNEGTIKGVISGLRELVKNWRAVVDTIKTTLLLASPFISMFVLAELATTKLGKSMYNLAFLNDKTLKTGIKMEVWLNNLRKKSLMGALAAKTLSTALKGLSVALPIAAIGLLINGITKLIYKYNESRAKAKELKQAFASIDTELDDDLNKGIESYKELVAQINDVTLSYNEREKAMQRLKRQFQDILPDQYLELEYISNMAEAYDKATEALRNHYNSKAREQKDSKLNDIFGEDILEEASVFQNKYANTFATRLGISTKSVRAVLDKTIEEVKNGTIEAQNLYETFLERLQTYSGKTISDIDYKTFYKGNEKVLKGLINVLKDYEEYRGDISGLPFETKQEEEAYKQREEAKKQLDVETNKINALKKAYEEYYKAKKKGASQDELRQLREEAYTIYKQLNVRDLPVYKEFQQISNSMFDIEKEIASVATKAYDKFIAKESKKENPLIKQLTEEATKAKNAYNASDIRKASEEIARVASNQFGVDLKIFDKIRVSQDDTLTNALTNAKAEIDARKSVITAYDNSVESLKKLNLTESERASTLERTHGYTKAEMELYKKETEAITSYYNALGGDNELSKQTKKSSKETLNSQISLIKEMHEKYKDLHEEFSSITAEQKVMNSYAEAFSEIFENTPISLITREIKKGLLDTLTGTGQISQQVRDEIDKLIETGVHIRNHTEDFVDDIKRREGFTSVAKDIGDGVWTYGYGDTIGVKKGDTITKEEADMKLRKRLTDTFVAGLNEVLDKNKELILTQQQYNALLDLTYQGGQGAVKRLIEYAKNSEKAIEHVTNIQSKVSSVFGKEAAERFGETFIQKLKDSEDIYARIALLLQTMNLTVKGGQISADLYKGMQKRSDERAGIFSGTLEITKAIQKASIETSNINIKTAEGVVQTLKGLLPYAKKFGDDVYKELLKAIAGYEAEIELEAKIKEREDIATQLDALFQGYELSLDLKELKLPTEYLKDIFKIDATNLNELQSKVNEYIAKLKEGASEVIQDENSTKEQVEDARKRVELAEETEKKISKIIDEEQLRRAKKYTQYLIKSQSEAVKIKLEEMRQIAEIESLKNVSDPQKAIMKNAVREEAQEKLDKAAWNSFKDSDMYIRMFEDLESQSTRSINRMREELENYRTSLNDLDPASLKEIASRLDALDEQIAKRNPFKGLAESYKTFAEIQAKYGSEKNLELYLNKSREEESLLQKEIDSQHLVKQEAEERVNDAIIKGDVRQIALAKSLLNIEEFKLNTLLEQLVAQKKITQEQADDLRNLQKSRKMFSGSMSDIGSDISEVSNALPTLMGDLESMGIGFSDSMKDAVESVAEIGSGVGNAIQGFASGNYVQGVLGVTQAIAGVFKIGDKKKEREIKALTEKVEELGRAYEKLQKQIENAFSLDQFRAGYAQSKENIEQQIQATEDMIAAEEAKKNTDNERIKEWQNNIEEYKEQLKELEDQRLQELGGFGESGIKSAADDFVDAWLSAYQETGDGLDALEDKWDEYIRNIIKKQMALRVADKVIEPITKKIDEALDGSDLLDEDLAEIEKMTEEKSKEFNQMMHQLANYFGSATDALKENVELSGLTQGIQGVTEQTADQLAGLVNSIRLYSANNNATLIRIADAMEQNKPQTENPMVAQLRQLVMHTESIYDLLNNLTIDGGKSIHVKM